MSTAVAATAVSPEEEVRGWDDRREPWLVEAHKRAVARWYPKFITLDRLDVWRVDEHIEKGVDTGYQRPVKESRVQDIVANFDTAAARDLYVSRRPDGSLWLLDGQHTAEALKRLGFTGWPCRIFVGLSISQEAEWFDVLNSNTQKIPSVVDHNAKVLSGKETNIIIDEVLDRFYLRIASARIRDKEGSIPFSSASMFEQILRMGGDPLLTETLQLCVDAWGHKKSSFMARIMTGMAYLLAWNEVPLDRARMVAVLANTTPPQIVETLGSTGSGGGPSKCARALVDLYNTGVPSDGYPKIRANSVDAPKLPDRKIGRSEGSSQQVFWTEETHDIGRKVVGPYVAPVKPTAAEKVASQVEGLMGDVTAPTATAEAPEAPEVLQEDSEDDYGSDGSAVVSIPLESAEAVEEAAKELEEDSPVPAAPEVLADDDEEWESVDASGPSVD